MPIKCVEVKKNTIRLGALIQVKLCYDHICLVCIASYMPLDLLSNILKLKQGVRTLTNALFTSFDTCRSTTSKILGDGV